MNIATIERPNQLDQEQIKVNFSLDNLGSYEPQILLFCKLYHSDFSFENIKEFIQDANSFETRNMRVKAFQRFYKNNITNSHALNLKLEEIKPYSVKIQDAPIEIPITKDDCLKVVKYLWSKKAEQGKNTDELKYKRLSLIVKTLFATGLRISELIGITNNHIKTNGVCKITVLGKGNKSRQVKIPMELYSEIKTVFSEKSEYLFCNSHGNKLQQSNLFAEIRKAYNDKLGINNVGLHTHRHLFATELIKAGIPINEVSKKLGHSSISVTTKYLHNTTDDNDIWSKLGI
jgi:site-specific recombinase XerD